MDGVTWADDESKAVEGGLYSANTVTVLLSILIKVAD